MHTNDHGQESYPYTDYIRLRLGLRGSLMTAALAVNQLLARLSPFSPPAPELLERGCLQQRGLDRPGAELCLPLLSSPGGFRRRCLGLSSLLLSVLLLFDGSVDSPSSRCSAPSHAPSLTLSWVSQAHIRHSRLFSFSPSEFRGIRYLSADP